MDARILRMVSALGAALVLFILFPFSSFGKNAVQEPVARIAGSVYEVMNVAQQKVKGPVADAFVSLRFGQDSCVAMTDKAGHFALDAIPAGRARIRVSKLGYRDYVGVIDATEGVTVLLIQLKVKQILLASAIVSEEASPVTHRGDTVIFSASAVRTSSEDSALEILAQMPGVTIQNGVITVNGEPVKRTYVNGRLIFGDNSMTPLVSIMASDVLNIKSYEEASINSRRLGILHDRKERVLDITTRDPIVSAFDGHAMLSGGIDTGKDENGQLQGRYGAGLVANFFSEKFLAYTTAHANNLQKTSFRRDEFLRSEGALRKYTELAGVSAGVEKYWGDRLLGNHVKVLYDYNHDYTRDRNRSVSDYFSPDGSLSRTDTDAFRSASTGGEHNVRVSSNLYSPKAGNFAAGLGFRAAGTDQRSVHQRSVILSGGDNLLQDLTDQSGGRNYSLDGSLVWTGNQSRSAWIPEAAANIRSSRDKGCNIQADTLATSAIFRHLTADRSQEKFNVSGQFFLRKLLKNDLQRTSSLSFSVFAYLLQNHCLRESLNILPDKTLVPNLDNSFDYVLSDIGVTPTFSYEWGTDRINLSASLSPGFVNRKDKEAVPSFRETGKWYFVPSGILNLKAGPASANYSFRHTAPTADQFREWVDDGNPLFITMGNASVKPSKLHSLIGNYAFPKVGKAGSLILSLSSSLTLEPIVAAMEYCGADTPLPGGCLARAGATLLSYRNADFDYYGRVSASWQQRVQKIKTTFAVRPELILRRNQAFVEGSPVNTFSLEPGLYLQANIRPSRKLSFLVSTIQHFTRTATTEGMPVLVSLANHTRAQAHYQFAGHWFVKGFYTWDATWFFRSTGLDSSFHILDLVLGTTLLKGRMGVSVSLNDLLNASAAFKNTVQPNLRIQQWSPASGRYILLNVSFRLNKKNPVTEYRGVLQEGGEMMPTEIKYR